MLNPCEIYNKAKNNYGLGYEKTPNVLKTRYILDKIASLLKDKSKGVYDPSGLQKEVENFFLDPESGFNWKHDQQAKEQAYDTTCQILRYVNSENRKPMYLNGREIVMPTGKVVYVKPTEVFISTNTKGQRIIEVVKIKTSKPKISQTKAENGHEDAIVLEELLKFGQTLLSKHGEEYVIASVYYLRKDSDKYSDTNGLNGNFDENFFDLKNSATGSKGGKNIVKIIETYRNGLKLTLGYNSEARVHKSFALPDYDQIFKESCEHAYSKVEASECSPTLCETCPIKAMCPKHYTEAPLAINAEKEVVKAKRMKLTTAQQAAADFDSGLCRINAGAGAGKTSVVKSHFISLCNKGFDPTKILVITFTNSGAEEMRSRIVSGLKRNGVDVEPEDLWILTFNAFGDIILKSNYYKLGYEVAPKLIDDIERSRIITEVLKENPVIKGLDYRNFTLNKQHGKGALPVTAAVFSLAKKYSLSAYVDSIRCAEMMRDKFAIGISAGTSKELLKLYPKYEDKLHESNLIEFDDQIANIFELLFHEPDLFENLGFEHIIVDEFQDTDQQQIDILKQLIDCPSFKSLMVVGDDSQAIYGFRETSPDYIIHFEDYIGSPLTDIYLVENFRSTPEVIDFANKINNMNTSKIAKNLVATRPSGDPVTVVGFGDTNQEYSYIVEQIKQNIADGVKPEDIAFIGYTKSELRKMGDLLSKEGITSVMMNPELLQENSRVLAGLAMLKALQNPADRKSLLTYASSLNGKNIMDLSFAKAQKAILFAENKLAECRRMPEPTKKAQIVELLKELDRNDDEVYESFITSIEFKPTVGEMYNYARDFEEFGDRAAVRRSHSYPGVVLTTAHSSKGLEWPIAYVSVSKFDDEVLSRKLETVEERRRLLFVSATRARDRLIVTGTWVAYTTSNEFNPKVKTRWYNKFLLNAFEAIGEEFSDEDLTKIYTIFRTLKAEERQKEKRTSAFQIKPKHVTTFNPRKMRTLRKKGRQTVKRHNRLILK